jgi:cysteine-rich repeat protein
MNAVRFLSGVCVALGVVVAAAHAGCGGSDSGGLAPTDDGGTDATTGDGGHVCGNGVVEPPEYCDNGANNGPGKGCERDCTFTCTTDTGNGLPGLTRCTADPCKGTLTCAADHTCAYGQAPPAGTSCGTGKICRNGQCTPAVCGDGIVEPPEECDDGGTNGTGGCTTSCKLTCVSTDPTRNCTSTNACVNNGTCNDATHVCTAGSNKPDGTSCGTGGADGGAGSICRGGVCVSAQCGDGIVEPGEQCDFGTGNGAGTGCELDCQFSCQKTPADTCTPADPCTPKTCTTDTGPNGGTGQKCVTGAPLGNGTTCTLGGQSGTCQNGSCVTSNCGNSVVDPGEQCDWGTNNATGSGCDTNCQFSCQTTPSDTCPNLDPCNANYAPCTTFQGTNPNPGQKCVAGTVLGACAVCGNAGKDVCINSACTLDTCGSPGNCVDPAAGVQCAPPNTPTCSATCQTIVVAVCGNGTREPPEQCDDGNTTNLDGCDSACKFEQDSRANQVQIVFGPSTLCGGPNALGGAIASAAQGNVQTSLSNDVTSGVTTIMLKFMGITDLSGTSQTTGLQVGGLGGKPQDADAGTYNGNNDLDWWYGTDPNSIDAQRNPKSLLTASFAAKVLSASGTFDLGITLGGSPANLHMSSSKVQANVGGVSTPATSTGLPPGHLASENLDPALQSFDSMTNGELCGNVSALSLSTIAAPMAVLNYCSQYTGHSLLDVLVGGCSTLGGIIPIINQTQPDQVDPAAPPAGTGAPYTLVETNNAVTGCNDSGSNPVNLQACLTAAAYSSDFTFTMDRVIAK